MSKRLICIPYIQSPKISEPQSLWDYCSQHHLLFNMHTELREKKFISGLQTSQGIALIRTQDRPSVDLSIKYVEGEYIKNHIICEQIPRDGLRILKFSHAITASQILFKQLLRKWEMMACHGSLQPLKNSQSYIW